MTKIILKILNVLFILNVICLTICYTFKEIFINDILIETIRTRMTQTEYKEPRTIEDVITERGVITDNELVNEMLQSKEIQELVNRYFDTTIESLLSEDGQEITIDPIQLEEDVKKFIIENKEILSQKTGIEITDEMIDTAFQKINQEDLKKSMIQQLENTKRNLSPKEKKLLRIYQLLVSEQLKRLLWLLLIGNIILRMILENTWWKWIRKVAILVCISGFMNLIISFGIQKLAEKFLGNISIQTTPLVKIGVTMIFSSLLIFILYHIFMILKGEKHEVSRVSIE